jgi:hypothetical protein
MADDEKFQNEEEESADDFVSPEEKKKTKFVAVFGILILVLAVILLSGCVVYSYNFNRQMAEKTTKVQKEYKKLRKQVIADANASEEEASENNQSTQESKDQSENKEKTTDSSDSENDEKEINSTDEQGPYVTYENYAEGKKFTFSYPVSWDGKVIFSNETKEDGSVVITCYHNEQYLAYQKGAQETGEIFHILVNRDPKYQSEHNDQYKISEKDGYCGYYEEPSGVTYDYVNHPEYAKTFKMVYNSQGKIFKSFTFN